MAAVSSEKATRYDRQLRLWGDHGQAALEASHVCLINASATGRRLVCSHAPPSLPLPPHSFLPFNI